MSVKYVLGIETSCDDTCAGVIDFDNNLLSNIVSSQVDDHTKFGGVVPELASRAHYREIRRVVQKSLDVSNVALNDIDLISVTSGPGLIGGLIVGVVYAQTLSSILKKPLIGINHLEAHVLVPKMQCRIEYPYLALLMSGGHCQFVVVKDVGEYEVLGKTLDDSIGEAFDKVGNMLGLKFPAGKEIEKYAKEGDSNRFVFPKPMFYSKDMNLSFSGLKNAVRLQIQQLEAITRRNIADISASFQKTVSDLLLKKISLAMDYYGTHYQNKVLVICGGVASNFYLRNNILKYCEENNFQFVVPNPSLCTDNGVMVAFAALERFKSFNNACNSVKAVARWPIGTLDAK